jgi:hypothetical protein
MIIRSKGATDLETAVGDPCTFFASYLYGQCSQCQYVSYTDKWVLLPHMLRSAFSFSTVPVNGHRPHCYRVQVEFVTRSRRVCRENHLILGQRQPSSKSTLTSYPVYHIAYHLSLRVSLLRFWLVR